MVIISSVITLLVTVLCEFAVVPYTRYHGVSLLLAEVVCLWSAPYLRALHPVQFLQLTTFERNGPDVAALFDWTSHESEPAVLI